MSFMTITSRSNTDAILVAMERVPAKINFEVRESVGLLNAALANQVRWKCCYVRMEIH